MQKFFQFLCLVGGSASENSTYIIQSATTTMSTSPCTYTICPCNSNICRIRFDFSVNPSSHKQFLHQILLFLDKKILRQFDKNLAPCIYSQPKEALIKRHVPWIAHFWKVYLDPYKSVNKIIKLSYRKSLSKFSVWWEPKTESTCLVVWILMKPYIVLDFFELKKSA